MGKTVVSIGNSITGQEKSSDPDRFGTKVSKIFKFFGIKFCPHRWGGGRQNPNVCPVSIRIYTMVYDGGGYYGALADGGGRTFSPAAAAVQ